jgi:hypothetical protein
MIKLILSLFILVFLLSQYQDEENKMLKFRNNF